MNKSLVTYDFHSHILPGIDDGSKDPEMSLVLIKELVSKGFTDICLTPHYYTNQESFEDFVNKRDKAFDLLMSVLPSDLNVRFHLGAEVYLTDFLFNQDYDNRICYDQSRFILTEFSYSSSFEDKSLTYLYKLLNRHMIPVIAHVERYPKLLKNTKKRYELLDMGVIFQSNFSSFTDGHYKRKLVKMINDDEISILGTDVHNMERNSPDDIMPALEYITKKCSKNALVRIQENSKEILDR